jgi:serine/threonine protein phosphatase 1
MYFPIGDIHGEYDATARLYDKIVNLVEGGIDPAFGGTIVFLGDYIDRGKDTKKVLDFLMNLKDTDNLKHHFLMGNHEEFMLHCRYNPNDQQTAWQWLKHGGRETLEAFNADLQDLHDGVLDNYIEWMIKLPLMLHDPDYVFVHAAIDPNIKLEGQLRERCLWHFEENPMKYTNYRKIVVHGHMTKKEGPIIDIPNNRIWMDVGANFRKKHCTVGLPEPFEHAVEIKTYWV